MFWSKGVKKTYLGGLNELGVLIAGDFHRTQGRWKGDTNECGNSMNQSSRYSRRGAQLGE